MHAADLLAEHRAADALGVEKRKEGFKPSIWRWYLPKMPSNTEGANTESVASSAALASSRGDTEGF
ncbi:hypothetical protein GWK36_09010 [Caldichromatium japonicum]|uniref:Uncharacterized protein n=1 Tax=Caldichromatium japonicum TaxID=2699430 RepID=A0A6G7VDS0_9GAMM|nr:hypothetical protein [Caldichromatium japonicum]QIK38102.1 hypothetical protein GWK36_09010 [Caldichromatium japonicum]